MASITLTSPAFTDNLETLNREEIGGRLQQAGLLVRTINDQVAVLVNQLGVLDRQQQDFVARQSPTLDELLADPSYGASDYDFVPSALDNERLENMNTQQDQFSRQDSVVKTLEARIQHLQHLQLKIDCTREYGMGNVRYGLANIWWWEFAKEKELRNTMKQYEQEILDLQAEMPTAQQKIAEAREQLAIEIPKRDSLSIHEYYDAATLHSLPAAEVLTRDRQAVLMSLDDTTVTLRIPESPEDKSFTKVVTLDSSADREAFAALIGRDVSVQEKRTGNNETMEYILEYGSGMDEQFVRFPLEVVNVGGRDLCRIPQAVWTTFSKK